MRLFEVELPGVQAVFTTREWGDVRSDPTDSGKRLDVQVIYGRQVHGADVRVAGAATDPQAPPIEADGIVTTAPGLAPLVFTADCLPIVIAGGGAVAAVHAGWRGLDAGVIAAAVQAIRQLVGPAESLAAVMGPAAGPCCYEVSDDLHARFAARGEDVRNGANLDLLGIAHRQLDTAGVTHVDSVSQCTICGADGAFFSYRREGEAAGRQAAMAWLT